MLSFQRRSSGRESASADVSPEPSSSVAPLDLLPGEEEVGGGTGGSGVTGGGWSDALLGVAEAAGAAWDGVTSGLDEAFLSVEALAAFVQRVGEGPARGVVDLAADLHPEVVAGFLSAHPSTGLSDTILTRLHPDLALGTLRGLGEVDLAEIFALAIRRGVLPRLMQLAVELATPDLGFLRLLAPPLLAVVWTAAPEPVRRALVEAFVGSWPLGMGVKLEAGLGATFGVPIRLTAEASLAVQHAPALGTFTLTRRGEVSEGGDTGVGGGAYGSFDGGRGPGIGAEAGVEVNGGSRQIVEEEYQFPVAEDASLVPLVLLATGTSGGLGTALAEHLPGLDGTTDPTPWLTKTTFEAQEFTDVSAEASGGLRVGTPSTVQGVRTWNHAEGAPDTGTALPSAGKNPLIQTLGKVVGRDTSASLAARVSMMEGVGLELEYRGFETDASGQRVPSEVGITASGRGQAALALSQSIPGVPDALACLPQGSGSVGIRASWTFLTRPGEAGFSETAPTWEIVGESGSSKANVELGPGAVEPSFDSLSSLVSSLQSVTIERSFGLPTPVGSRMAGALAKQGAMDVLLPTDYRKAGVTMSGSLTLVARLTPARVGEVLELALRSVRDGAGALAGDTGGGEEGVLRAVYTQVVSYLAVGGDAGSLAPHLDAMAERILGGVTSLDLHAEVGLAAAAGAKVAILAKARGDAHAGAAYTLDRDVLDLLGGQLSLSDIRALLAGGFPSEGTLTLPAEGEEDGDRVAA